jgi:WD40 repeat protein/class 3 adenylate cyclase
LTHVDELSGASLSHRGTAHYTRAETGPIAWGEMKPSEAETCGDSRPVARAFVIADIRGYTAFTRAYGDERAGRLAKKFADLARDAAEARNGSVIELRGDEALAVFTSTAQAVRAALELQAACREETAREPDLALPVGIGIDVGEAVSVEDGFRGVALNMAARLCSKAAAGDVLVTRAVAEEARAVEGLRAEERGTVELKGFDRPVDVIAIRNDDSATAWIPLPPSGADGAPLPDELDAMTTLVGRVSELRWLRGTWRQARRGLGRVVVVSGPAGIGKTRLAAELAAEAHDDGASVGYAGAGGAGTALSLAAVTDAARASTPTLVVLDDLEATGEAVAAALASDVEAMARRPVLVIGLCRDPVNRPGLATLVERTDARGDGHRRLGPLDSSGLTEIARSYLGEGVAEAPIESMARASGGIPARIHEVVSAWARDEASRQVAAAAEWLASGRARLRATELKLANNAIGLRLARLYAGADEPEPDGDRCPFKGLSSFGESDAGLFFGRERLVGELAARSVGTGLVGVIGPSGSGKSSLVSAGLLPSLAAGLLPASERWVRALMRPGEHPLHQLRSTLAAALGEETDGDPLAAAGATVERMGSAGRLVLVIDQFEEVFTMCQDEERQAFVAVLTRAATTSPKAIGLVVVIRGDFYGHCAEYAELAELLGTAQVLVGPMTREELRRAIELPARRAGLRVEASLAEALVEQVADEPGGLPLLSTALVELWESRRDRWLRLEDFERTGGVHGAVARLAESAYEQLTSAEQAIGRAIFLRLAGPGEGAALVRRRASLSEFDIQREPSVGTVISFLTARRLLTRNADTVEVAHEALLREWPRLTAWLEEDAQGRQLHRHLIGAASQWDQASRDAAELYRGARLSAVMDWAAAHGHELNELERAFVAESRRAAEREADRARRTNRRLRGLLAGVAVVLVIAIVAAALALVQRGRAREEAIAADARLFAARAATEERLDRSLLFAMAGVQMENSIETQSALLSALLRSPAALHIFHGPGVGFNDVAVSPDGRTIAASVATGSVFLFDTASGRPIGDPVIICDCLTSGAALALDFSPHGRTIAITQLGTDQQTGFFLHLIDVETGKVRATAGGPGMDAVAFSPDGDTLATVGFGGVIGLFDPETGQRTDQLDIGSDAPNIPGIAFLPDGNRVVVAASDGTSELWDLGTRTRVHTYPGVGGTVAVSPDGGSAAVQAVDGALTLLDLRTGKSRRFPQNHEGVAGVAFGPDGSMLVSANFDGTVIEWDVDSMEPLQTLTGHSGRPLSLALTTDGTTAYTTAADATIIEWDLAGDRRLGRTFTWGQATPGDFVPVFALDSSGKRLAVPRVDGTVEVWDIPTLSKLAELPAPLGTTAVSFAPHGDVLATGGGEDGSIVLWQAGDWNRVGTLSGDDEPVVSSVAFSPDGNVIAAGRANGSVSLWDVGARKEVDSFSLGVDVGPASDVEFSNDGRLLLVNGCCLTTPEVMVWRLADRRRVLTLPVVVAYGAAELSPDGTTLAIADIDGNVQLYDARTGRPSGSPIAQLDANGESIDFSPDGTTLVATSGAGSVLMLDVTTGKPLGPSLPGPVREHAVARFSPDRATLVVTYAGGTAIAWDTRLDAWQARACRVAGRDLTPEEWHDLVPNRDFRPVC